jgi:TrmH family RNA methyltransferase
LSQNCPFFVCACEIQDPGNLGSLIRTAAAAGCSMLCSTKGTVSARNPKAVRASAGTFFRLAVVEGLAPADLLRSCKEAGVELYRTSALEGADFQELSYTGPIGILLGNEGQGFQRGDWAGVPALSIPMAHGVESLNVAAAGAIIMFEAARQRRASATRPDSTPAGERRL